MEGVKKKKKDPMHHQQELKLIKGYNRERKCNEAACD